MRTNQRLVGCKDIKKQVSWTRRESPEWPGDAGACHETFAKVSNQIETVFQCARQISRSAESLGAVAFESRISAAVKVLVLYVDHVQRKWEKERRELDDIKRILSESGVNVDRCLAALPSRNVMSSLNTNILC